MILCKHRVYGGRRGGECAGEFSFCLHAHDALCLRACCHGEHHSLVGTVAAVTWLLRALQGECTGWRLLGSLTPCGRLELLLALILISQLTHLVVCSDCRTGVHRCCLFICQHSLLLPASDVAVD